MLVVAWICGLVALILGRAQIADLVRDDNEYQGPERRRHIKRRKSFISL